MIQSPGPRPVSRLPVAVVGVPGRPTAPAGARPGG